jgi:hypothetical protein
MVELQLKLVCRYVYFQNGIQGTRESDRLHRLFALAEGRARDNTARLRNKTKLLDPPNPLKKGALVPSFLRRVREDLVLTDKYWGQRGCKLFRNLCSDQQYSALRFLSHSQQSFAAFG